MPGVAEYALAVACFHYLSLLHHHDGVGDIRHHRQVVADEDHADITLVLQLGDQLEDLCLDGDIQGRGGLVGDQQLGFVDQRHGDHHPLAHAAGKLVGKVVDGRLGVAYAYLRQQLQRPGPGLGRRHLAVVEQRLHQLLADGHIRIQAGHRILEDHGDIATANPAQLGLFQL